MNRDLRASQILGQISLKTASDIRDSRNPNRSRVSTWLYANPQALLIISDRAPLPHFWDVEYLDERTILLRFAGQDHRLTAPPIVPNGIIEFPNSMAIAGPKKYMKTVSQFIQQSGL